MIGLLIVAVMVSIGVLGPLLAPYDPDTQFRGSRLESPNREFLLGTDNLGRDLLSRLLHGARLSIGMAALATVFIVLIAVVIGAVAGYVGGLPDDLAMRVVDVILAFPGIILALAIVGVLGPGLGNVMMSLVLVAWAGYARLVRGLVLETRERPFVEAGGRDRLQSDQDHAAPYRPEYDLPGDRSGVPGDGDPDPGSGRFELSRPWRAASDVRMGIHAQPGTFVFPERTPIDDLSGRDDQSDGSGVQPVR